MTVCDIPEHVRQLHDQAHDADRIGDHVRVYARKQLQGALSEGWTLASSLSLDEAVERIREGAFLHYLGFVTTNPRDDRDALLDLIRCAQLAANELFAQNYCATPADDWVEHLRRRPA